MLLGKAGEEKIGSELSRRQSILEQGERMCMEKPQRTRLGMGQDVLGMVKLGEREKGEISNLPYSCKKHWRPRSSDHNGPAEGTSTSEKSQPEDR